MLKNKNHVKTSNAAAAFLICFGVSVLLIILISFVMAIIANTTENSTAMIGIFSLVSMLLSALLSGLFICRFRRESGVGYAALVALSVVLIMLLISVIVSNGKVGASSFMNYGCYLGVVTLSALVFRKRKRHGGR